ncbi:MAG: CDP-alcohol phosphatidyltransferase family protein [Oscillospiraceae bacterium]|nr:CDP-alcohol phosphatidyltransferase family protein [Oscillospiraceae bacterium]
MKKIKNIANIITVTRILAALLMIIEKHNSALFWVLYIYCFVSDILDGYIARKKKTASNTGAILDSVADTIFFFAVFISVLPSFVNLQWLLWGFGIVALIRAASYLVGYVKYHSFASLHTLLNKLTGFLLIVTPLMLMVVDIKIIGIIVGGIAFVSAIEELLIVIWSKELNRDIKSIFE